MKLFFFVAALFLGINAKQNNISSENTDFPSKKELLGQINPAKHKDFVKIDPSVSYFPEIYLRKQSYQAFLKMHEAALNDGIFLFVRSGTRNYYDQRFLWNQKFDGKRINGDEYIDQNLSDSIKIKSILKYSSIPGISRHHWGTDIDINSINSEYFQSGKGKKVYDWLLENAETFGFYQVYIPFCEDRKTGFNHEEWHWTYKPESDKFTKAFKHVVSYGDLTDFKGAKYAKAFNVIEDYVYGINPVLL